VKKTIASIAAAGLVGLAPAAMADSGDQPETRFYVAPMASYNFSQNHEFEPSSHGGGQLSFGKNFGDYFAMELYGFFYNDMNVDGGYYAANPETDVTGYGVSALFFPARDILPVYAVAGYGFGDHDFSGVTSGPDVGSQDSRFYDVGAGYMIPLNDYGIKLRTEYRYRRSKVDNPSSGHYHFHDNVVSVGFQIPLGAPASAAEPEPVDTGPVDSDGDGVIDARDECPGTPQGVEVDAVGCPIEKEEPVVLQGVTFKFDSSELTARAQNRLNNVVDALDASPDVQFSIAGHTDSIGSKAYNQKLSERRAHSVEGYLVNENVESNRITSVRGYGETRPVATNETKEGRAKNRRVELNVEDQ